MTDDDLCVYVLKTGRLTGCIWAVGYFRKEKLKDEKEELNNLLLLCK